MIAMGQRLPAADYAGYMGQSHSMDAAEAKNQFSSLLERVSDGETVTITRLGKPIAVLGPVPAQGELTPSHAVASILNWRKNSSLDGLSTRELRDEGKRR